MGRSYTKLRHHATGSGRWRIDRLVRNSRVAYGRRKEEIAVPFKVGIIGAGWYGCHLASSLLSLGFEVTVFERSQRVLDEASGNNQFRLHLGFHYARHHGTRQQSRDGFLRFIERYPNLSASVARNIYAVPKNDSLIDFQTYKMIMASSGVDFTECADTSAWLDEIDGALLTPERVLMISRARYFFTQRLMNNLRLGEEVISISQNDKGAFMNGEAFDYIIDASWGKFTRPTGDIFFEPTLLLYYEASDEFPAITLVDGPLSSIYPTEDPHIFTLSSVSHTPLGRFEDPSKAKDALAKITGEQVTEKRQLMEHQISKNVPAFKDVFRFSGAQLSMKTKLTGRVDDRSCYVHQSGRLFSVMSGKIDTVFHATERILSLIEAEHSQPELAAASRIRDDILQLSPTS